MSERQWRPGDLIVWHHVPRGGYNNFVHVVPGVVVRIGVDGVSIAVRKTDGFVVQRWVKRDSLSSAHAPRNVEMAMSIAESLQPRLRIVKASHTGSEE